MPRDPVFVLGGDHLDIGTLEAERIFSYQVRIYDRSGNKVGEFASEVKNVRLVNLQFGYLQDGGCADFSFTLGDDSPFTIDYNYRVEICFYGQVNPWYSGFITKLPDEGTENPKTYSGYGYAKQLAWIRVNETDTAQEIATIIEDTLDTYIVPNTDIVKDADKIPVAIYAMISTIYWERIPANELFERLRQLAGDYEWGVDEERDFYFRAIDTEVRERFWIGKHLDVFRSSEDQEPIANRIYVRCGRLTDGSDYVFYVEDATSQATYGLREEVVTAPEFWPTISATDLASGIVPTTNPIAGVPANATDGNTATYWDSGVAQAVGHYIQVDLGAIFDHISRVVLDSTDDAAAEQFARAFDIRISTTGAFAGEEVVVFTSTALSTNRPDIRFTPTQGRYVRVTLTGADTEQWHLGEYNIYELDTSDVERWANYILDQKKDIRKKATLTIRKVNEQIERKHVIVPYQPRGVWSIYDEEGNAIEDYQVKSVKYTLTADSFDMSAELGHLERETVPAEFKRQLQRMEENRMSGIRSSDDLAGGTGLSPLSIPETVIQRDAIKTPMLYAGQLNLANGRILIGWDANGADLHGMVVTDNQAIPVVRLRLGHIAAGLTGYGIQQFDANGLQWSQYGELYQVWQRVYDAYLAADTTTITISGLTGDTDQVYFVKIRNPLPAAITADISLRLNNDAGNNYGRVVAGTDGAAGIFGIFDPSNRWALIDAAANGEIGIGWLIIDAREGMNRMCHAQSECRASGTTIGRTYRFGQIYDDDSTEITRIDVYASVANGFGDNGHLAIYRIPSFP